MAGGAGTKKKRKERRLTAAAEFDLRLDRMHEALDKELLRTERDMKRVELQIQEDRKRSREADERAERWAREADKRAREADKRAERWAQEAREARGADREWAREADERAEKRAREADERAEKRAREAALRAKDLDRSLNEVWRRIDANLDRVGKNIDESTVYINKIAGTFDNKWGRFLEKFVTGDLKRLLATRGIRVDGVSPVRKFKHPDDKNFAVEYDIISARGEDIAVVEVKTTLRRGDVEAFVRKLEMFRDLYGMCNGKRVIGAVACLDIENERLEGRAMREGLLVIRAPGGDTGVSVVVNPKGFAPREF